MAESVKLNRMILCLERQSKVKLAFVPPNVPNGWLLSVDSFGRKYYYNEIEKDKNLVK